MAGMPCARQQRSFQIPQEMAKQVFFDRSGATACAQRSVIRIFPGRCPMQVHCSNKVAILGRETV